MTTLENSYCVPNNSQWEELIGYAPDRDTVICAVYDAEMGILDANADEVKCLTEIPVSRFQDLLHDRIVGWRLEEVGFVKSNNSHRLQVSDYSVDWVWSYNFAMVTGPRGFSDFKGITTFTDLLTLIRMLTPNTNKP